MFTCGAVLLGIVVLLLFWVVARYNGLVTLRNQVANAWKQIDVQLKRRYDLIPNLVSAVKGEMKFEQDTLEKVIQARNQAVATAQNPGAGIAAQAQSENALTATLSRFIGLVENYPNLKSNEQVRALMEELTSTENKIGFARQFYNDLATSYNIAQQVFPASFIASTFHFTPVELFQIPEGEATQREVPKVDLNLGT
ncbi:MAG TPA: LemA family protein [Thermoanaerobaculia bacterium]|nr:LemA family protein [Thermoanaerobaculia bacterium]